MYKIEKFSTVDGVKMLDQFKKAKVPIRLPFKVSGTLKLEKNPFKDLELVSFDNKKQLTDELCQKMP